MSKLILWFGLVLSIVFLSFGLLSGTAAAKPFVIVFWIVIGVACSYKLFAKKPNP